MKEPQAVPVVAPDRQGEAEAAAPRRGRLRPCLVLALLLTSFLGLELLLPLGTAVKIGADEHFELSKVTLCAHNYRLYRDIWDDQPPLLTSILSQLVRHISPRILGPRLLSVCLGLVLLSAFFLLVARLHGVLVAALATAMLIASPGFIELSASCMQEVPALAPIVAAFWVLAAMPRDKWQTGQLLAGALIGLGCQLKLTGAAYLPLAVLVISMERRQRAQACQATLSGSVLLFATAAAVFLGLNCLTGNPLLLQLHQSWAAHFSSAQSFEYGSPAHHPFVWTVLAKNWDTTLPALAGVFVLLPSMRRAPALHHLLPLAWLASTLLVFTLSCRGSVAGHLQSGVLSFPAPRRAPDSLSRRRRCRLGRENVTR
jgi:hypothetical protein